MASLRRQVASFASSCSSSNSCIFSSMGVDCDSGGSSSSSSSSSRSRFSHVDAGVRRGQRILVAAAATSAAAAAVATTAAITFLTVEAGQVCELPFRQLQTQHATGLSPSFGGLPALTPWSESSSHSLPRAAASPSSCSSSSKAVAQGRSQLEDEARGNGHSNSVRIQLRSSMPGKAARGQSLEQRSRLPALVAGAIWMALPRWQASRRSRRPSRRSRVAVADGLAGYAPSDLCRRTSSFAGASESLSSARRAQTVRGVLQLDTARLWSPLDALFGNNPEPESPEDSVASPMVKPSPQPAQGEGFVNSVVTVHNEDELNTLLASGADTVVKLAFTWCRPCKRFWPRFQKYAQVYKNTQFLRIVGNENESCKHFAKDVMKAKTSPMFAAYSGGQLVNTWAGANNARFIDNMEQHLPTAKAFSKECEEALEKDEELRK